MPRRRTGIPDISATDKIYQIKITLEDIKPPIWRRLAVPGEVTLSVLHDIILAVMGWAGHHLHEFRYQKAVYGIPDPEFGRLDIINERKIRLNQVISAPKRRLLYTYDFGDNWDHRLDIEAISEPTPNVVYPKCLDGKRACPPDDCGGPYGYERLLKIIGDPDDDEHETMLDWIGGEFDPEYFDVEEVNELLGDEFKLKAIK